jgi:hypothetical protein
VRVFGKLVKGVEHGWDGMVGKDQFGRVEAHEKGVKMIALIGGLGGNIDGANVKY